MEQQSKSVEQLAKELGISPVNFSEDYWEMNEILKSNKIE